MFREALGYPTRPRHGGRAILVGGTLLVLLAAAVGTASLGRELAAVALVAFVPWLLVRGYYVRVVQTTIGRERPSPPSFTGVERLLRDGGAAVLIAAAYLLPGIAVLAPLAYLRTREADLATLTMGVGVSSRVADGVTVVAGIVALFAIFALIGAAYGLPVAIARFAYTQRLRAAFDLRAVAAGAATEDYVVAWAVSVFLQVVVLPVTYLLKVILVGFYLHFLVAVAVRYCYGQGVGAALDLEPLDPARGVSTTPTDGEDVRSAVRRVDNADRVDRRAGRPAVDRQAPGPTADRRASAESDEHGEDTWRDGTEGERT